VDEIPALLGKTLVGTHALFSPDARPHDSTEYSPACATVGEPRQTVSIDVATAIELLFSEGFIECASPDLERRSGARAVSLSAASRGRLSPCAATARRGRDQAASAAGKSLMFPFRLERRGDCVRTRRAAEKLEHSRDSRHPAGEVSREAVRRATE
jgi:hypothetical protein